MSCQRAPGPVFRNMKAIPARAPPGATTPIAESGPNGKKHLCAGEWAEDSYQVALSRGQYSTAVSGVKCRFCADSLPRPAICGTEGHVQGVLSIRQGAHEVCTHGAPYCAVQVRYKYCPVRHKYCPVYCPPTAQVLSAYSTSTVHLRHKQARRAGVWETLATHCSARPHYVIDLGGPSRGNESVGARGE